MRTERTEEGLSVLKEFERLQTATRARNDAAWQIKLLTEQAREHAARQEYAAAADVLRRAMAYAPAEGSISLAAGAFLVRAGKYRGGHSTVERGIGARGDRGAPLSRGRVRRVGAKRGESCASRGVQGRQRDPHATGCADSMMGVTARTVASCGALACVCATSTLRGAPTIPPEGTTVTFTDITREAGLEFHPVNGASAQKHIVETMGSGALFFDFDDDGWVDVFLVDGGLVSEPAVAARARHRLYRNKANGQFEDVTGASGIEHHEYGMGACAADYDNDGRVDLYLTSYGPDQLFHNDGSGKFTEVTRRAGVGSELLGASCAFADIDNDGDVDLFVANYVDPDSSKVCGDARARAYCRPDVYSGVPSAMYRNNGDGTFTDVTHRRRGSIALTARRSALCSRTTTTTAAWICSLPTT